MSPLPHLASVGWYTPSGVVHHQQPGSDCSTCGVRHVIREAGEKKVCCGDAHTWPIPEVCLFCGQTWKTPALEGGRAPVIIPDSEPA